MDIRIFNPDIRGEYVMSIFVNAVFDSPDSAELTAERIKNSVFGIKRVTIFKNRLRADDEPYSFDVFPVREIPPKSPDWHDFFPFELFAFPRSEMSYGRYNRTKSYEPAENSDVLLEIEVMDPVSARMVSSIMVNAGCHFVNRLST